MTNLPPKINPIAICAAALLQVIPVHESGARGHLWSKLPYLILEGHNENAKRSDRITAAFLYFVSVGALNPRISEKTLDLLRDIGSELFLTLEITTDDLDILEDETAKKCSDLPPDQQRLSVDKCRCFRDIIKEMQHASEIHRPSRD